MGTVAEGEIFGFTAATGPDRAVFLHLDGMRGFARALMGPVAVGRIFGLTAGAEEKGLPGLEVYFVGEGLPGHTSTIVDRERKTRGNVRLSLRLGKQTKQAR